MSGLFDRGVVRGTITGVRVEVLAVRRGEADRVAEEGEAVALVLLRICTNTGFRLLAPCDTAAAGVFAGADSVESRVGLCLARELTPTPTLVPAGVWGSTGCPSALTGRAGMAFTSEKLEKRDRGVAEEEVVV